MTEQAADLIAEFGVSLSPQARAVLIELIAAALRAAEARALGQAAGLCAARARRWHKDSSAHRELLSAADAIRGLSEPPD